MENGAKTLAVDFDGVLNDYHGWTGSGLVPQPRKGVRDFLNNATKVHGFTIIIFTCRETTQVWDWLHKNSLSQFVYTVTNKKPVAMCYLDDRGIYFDGNFTHALNEIANFKTHWEK